jgi:2,3-bisphosphoglycerate-independent phosphoglycerate mutase
VTFFFNGGKEEASTKEERILVPSSSVATYDLCPEMSAPAITKTLVDAILTHRYDVIIANFANADMVGHTGNFAATVTAIECLDNCLSLIGEALKQAGGHMLITADHGNAEAMFNETTQEVHKAHTNQPVPFLYVGKEGWQVTRKHGTLIDIAPTLLTLLGLAIPKEMTGTSLLEKRHAPTN